MNDPLDPLHEDVDDFLTKSATQNLHRAAAAAISLGLLQFCCNPVFIVTFMAAGASLNALRLPSQYRISLDANEFPASAASLSTFGGVIGMMLTVLAGGIICLRLGGGLAWLAMQ